MENIRASIRIRFGLGVDPTDIQIDYWRQRTERLIGQGHDARQAGELAAEQVFPDYRTNFYASEGDSIETLLEAARERARRGS